jgi:hypothetical protein
MFCASFSRSPVAPEKKKQEKKSVGKINKILCLLQQLPVASEGGKKMALLRLLTCRRALEVL